MRTIVLNNTHLNKSDSTNSEYIYTFPNSVNFKDEQIALGALKIYYSWRNITSALGNNQFSYIWTNDTTYTVTITDGFYTIEQLNSYLQSIMIQNKHYLIDSTGNYVYYLELQTNSTTYAIELRSYILPTSQSNFTIPSGFVFPSTSKCPQFVIPNTNIQNIFGISAGTYPPTQQNSNYVKSSDFTPQVSPVQSVFLTCNLINSKYSYPSNILTSFAPDVTYGSLINIDSKSLIFNDVEQGYYNQIRIRFLDQNFSPLPIIDSNLIILLVIKNNKE